MGELCLYHSADLDGHCSGAICRAACPDVELYPIDYGEEIPWDKIKDSHLIVIDWSFQPWNEFIRAMRLAKSITWIDHHKSAIDDFRTNETPGDACSLYTKISSEYAGCELAWDYFFPCKTVPRGVHLLGRYDIWDHSDPDTLPFQHGMRMLSTDPLRGDPEVWEKLFSGPVDEDVWYGQRLQEGELLLRHQQQSDESLCKKYWFPMEFAGKKWQAANRLGTGSSFFASVWDSSKFHGMLSFGWDGKQWVVGLYSDREDVDCGAIAKSHGGGGHLGAAGFRTDHVLGYRHCVYPSAKKMP